jgi:D-arabinose 1-dehydrogenase-like Zn-dependent alcohol dehydrogenase
LEPDAVNLGALPAVKSFVLHTTILRLEYKFRIVAHPMTCSAAETSQALKKTTIALEDIIVIVGSGGS